jgi:hypothetical protein
VTHPYRNLPSTHFWSRVVAPIARHELDPLVEASFQISRDDGVATIGSCFAQHLSRFLEASGLNYLVTEPGPTILGDAERKRRSYGMFTARFGNVYTARQARQLLDRAFGDRSHDGEVWRRGDGRVIDPLRPTVEPDGFASPEAMAADEAAHLAAVRAMINDAAVIVFTLGLTEAWSSRLTGTVYPVVPGAAGGEYDDSRHEFVNFRMADVLADLVAIADRVADRNPCCQLLLTVSPVPLIATYSSAHVLTATTYSKSVLRVAAAEVESLRSNVHYFPSYEIITGAPAGNEYFEPDLRSVTEDGVAHVMRVFQHHYIRGEGAANLDCDKLRLEIAFGESVVCDEELLDLGW